MKTIQDIFNAVISSGLYNPHLFLSSPHLRYMCLALEKATSKGIITYTEAEKASKAIARYLESSQIAGIRSLYSMLEHLGRPHSPDNLLAIYSNWANRPRKKLKGASK